MTPTGQADRGRREGFAAALWPGLWLSGLLAALAFALSFSALSAVGIASGIDAHLGWAFPLIVDGFILLATWAAWRFRAQGLAGAWYPWAAFVVFSAVSMTGNALHARPVATGGLLLAGWAATAFSTVPSIALLVASHMLLLIATARPRQARDGEHADTSSEVRASPDAGTSAHVTSQKPPQPAARPSTVGPAREHLAESLRPDVPTARTVSASPVAEPEVASRNGLSADRRPRRSLSLVETTSTVGHALALVQVPQSLPSPVPVELVGTPEACGGGAELAGWVAGRVRAGLPVTGPDVVAAGLAASDSTARRWLRELRANSPQVFTS
jgi:hypothetical protein